MKLDSLVTIIETLNIHQVEYLIVGGLAVNAWDFVRPTKDVDIVIRLSLENIDRSLKALDEIDYHPYQPVTVAEFADEQKRAEWKRETGMVALKMWSDAHRETPIDIFIDEPFDFNKEYARARSFTVMPGTKAQVVTLGTLLRM